MNPREIQFLLPLLDDRDDEVYRAVRKKLIEEGPSYLPLLTKALDSVTSLLQNDRLESIILELRMIKTGKELVKWAHSENKSLLEGWILASSIQDSVIHAAEIEKQVRKIIQNIWLEFNKNQTSIEKISIINYVFYKEFEFRSIKSDGPPAELYFIDKVLQTKNGNNLSLNILYAVITRQLNLMLLPVAVNDRIYLAYHNPVLSREAFGEISHPFLFFVDIEQSGKIISIREFDYLLKNSETSWSTALILDNIHLLQKFFTEINEIFRNSGNGEKVIFTEKMLNFLKKVQ